MLCDLAGGTVATPGSLLALLDEALVERGVLKSRTRVEVGARTRWSLGATRRAIEPGGRVCRHPSCEEPVGRCQVDHIVPASEGGETTQENGCLACPWHNRLRVRSPSRPPEPSSP